MNYLYHWVPELMQGNTLYPLHQLKDIYPEAYARAMEKYLDRQELLKVKIPILNVLWNDVIHLTAVHPATAKTAQKTAGIPCQKRTRTFEIDPSALDPRCAVIVEVGVDDFEITPSMVRPFCTEDLENLTEIPDETKAYYRQATEEGKRPMVFAGVPHILYCGTIDITDLPIIEV